MWDGLGHLGEHAKDHADNLSLHIPSPELATRQCLRAVYQCGCNSGVTRHPFPTFASKVAKSLKQL